MGLAVLLALGFVVYWAFLVLVTLRMLLWPSRRTYAWCLANRQPETPADLSPPRQFQAGRLIDPRNRPHELPYWRIRGEAPGGPVIIFSHGWGESSQAVLQRLDTLLPLCREVIAWDLPGHGESPPGRVRLGANEADALADLILIAQGEDPEARERAAADLEATQEHSADGQSTLDTEPQPDAPAVVLHGFSLGAGVCLAAAGANRGRVAGVIAEAPYCLPTTPARNVMRAAGFPHRLNLAPALMLAGLASDRGPRWTGFDRAAIAADLACPLLVLHGSDDQICPTADGREIAAAAERGRFVEIAEAGHTDLWQLPQARSAAAAEIRAFLGGLAGGQTAGQ